MHPPSPARRLGAVCVLAVLFAACNETSDTADDCIGCSDASFAPYDSGFGAGLDGGMLVQLPDGGWTVIPGPGASDGGALVDGALPGADAGTDGAAPNTAETMPCGVQTLFDTYCKTCHAPNAIGGFNLATLADLRAPSKSDPNKLTYASVVDRINSKVVTTMMPPAGTPSRPTSTEVALITTWATMGAPAGEACSPSDAGVVDPGMDASTTSDAGTRLDGGTPDSGTPDSGVRDAGTPDSGTPPQGLQCYRLLAHASGSTTAAYKVGVANDAYINMTFAAPWQGTVYAQTFRPITDNGAVLHHWLLFKDGPGGQAGSVAPSSGTHPAGELVYGWAPGGTPLDLRSAATGLTLEGNTTYTMEYHYNSNNTNAEDRSGIELCVTSTPPANVATQSWLGRDRFSPSVTWSGTCTPNSNQRIHIVAINPHMHQQGRHMRAVINRAGGGSTVLHDADFDFNYQQTYTKDVWLEPGETITTTCTYAAPSSFGQATTQEMCYLFTMASPAGALADGNAYGQQVHGDNTCIGNPAF